MFFAYVRSDYMKMQILVRLGGGFVILLHILFGCSFKKASEKKQETILVDSLLSVYTDSLAANPLKVISVLRDNQVNLQTRVM